MKGKKKRLLAGTLALLLSCSTLLNTGITALASEQSEEHAQIQEVKQEEAASETLPELEEVKEQLTEEELVYAEDLTIKAGESFDLETDYRGFQKNDEKVKVTFLKAEGDSGNSFDFNTPGSYQAFYRVDPLSGNPSYQIMRRIVVEARENSTQEPQGEVSQHTEDGSGEDGEADPDPEIPEVLTEEPEMPDAGEELIDLTPKEDKGMFLSVVPAAMEQQKGSNVHLVQGEKIPYPSNVGNYSTSYFTVNGHVAYCLESMKASPPTSDYVANEFESNPELQKVLYYGYGGPGDITGEYMPSFDWKTKYIFTHLAAAYSYCGMDGFYGCTFEDIKASGVWGYIQHIYSLEAPPTAAITLSPKEAKAYESGKEQRTGEFTLKGDHRNYITLKMPEHVTYHSGSTKQTGTVKINGNTTFYFSAPKTVKETIYTPDGQKDEAGNRIVKYEKDALVARMVTDKEGKAVLNNLPIGKYYVVEEKAGQNCVLDPEAKEFEIAYKGQEVAVDYVTMELTNQRQKVSLSLLKKDAETGKPLEGVVFGLYAQEDIKNAAGEVVVEKDALIELGTTDEEGKLVFQADLPHGKYYIQEVEHKPGYLPNDEVYSFDASYTDQTLELLAFSEEISNQPTITEFTKVDLTGGQEIEGAKMQILDQEGKVVEEWVSKKEAHVVYALAPGEYILHEEQAPTEQGYVRAEDVKFVVEETGDVQKVKMEDDHTKVSISKTDITDGKEIEGAKLQILDQDGEVVESWTTGEEHLIEYLPVGTYTLHEEAAVDGYIVANDVEFTVEETGEIQKMKMEDERAMGQLVIVKTDTDSKAALEGVEFVLLEKETGKEVGRLKTGKDGKAVSELLPIGTYENGVFKEPITYVLKETATLKGYEKTEEEWEIVFTYQNDKTPVIEVVKEIQNKKIPETPGTVKPGPKTGDDTNWFLPLLALGVSAGMVAGLLYYRKRHKKA